MSAWPARRGPARRVLAAGALVAAVLVVAGCGVRPSGVITGGPGPSGRVVPEGSDTPALVTPAVAATVYLVQDGRLVAVPRPGERLSPGEALRLLAAGPTPQERARGLTTDVPPGAAPFTVIAGPDGRLAVTGAGPVGRAGGLSPLAVGQIACTAAAATSPGRDRLAVTVVGAGAEVDPRDCPA